MPSKFSTLVKTLDYESLQNYHLNTSPSVNQEPKMFCKEELIFSCVKNIQSHFVKIYLMITKFIDWKVTDEFNNNVNKKVIS